MGLAVQLFVDSKKQLPTGRNGTDQKSVSWGYFLLPYLEENAVYEAYQPSYPVDDPANANAMRTPIDVYACPSCRALWRIAISITTINRPKCLRLLRWVTMRPMPVRMRIWASTPISF